MAARAGNSPPARANSGVWGGGGETGGSVVFWLLGFHVSPMHKYVLPKRIFTHIYTQNHVYLHKELLLTTLRLTVSLSNHTIYIHTP